MTPEWCAYLAEESLEMRYDDGYGINAPYYDERRADYARQAEVVYVVHLAISWFEKKGRLEDSVLLAAYGVYTQDHLDEGLAAFHMAADRTLTREDRVARMVHFLDWGDFEDLPAHRAWALTDRKRRARKEVPNN